MGRQFVPEIFCRVRSGMTITKRPAIDMAGPPAGERQQDRKSAFAARCWRRFVHTVGCAIPARDQRPGEGYGFRLGPLVIFKTNTHDSGMLCGGELLPRDSDRQRVLVLLVLGGAVRGRSGDFGVELRHGDIGFLDLGHAVELHASEGSQLGLIIPRTMLNGCVHGLVLRESQLPCRMLTRHLEQLVLSLPVTETARAAMLVESTMAVTQLCVDFSPPASLEAACEPLRTSILRHIDANLDDVGLSPECIARVFGLSRTRLYQIFLGTGGIKRCIRDKRLDAAFRDLCNEPEPRVIDIAYRRGFSSERQFQRAFLARFGMTPSAVRNRRGDEPEPGAA